MSSFDRLVEMVKKVNTPSYPLTNQSVSFNAPSEDVSSTHNTRVSMQGLPQSFFTGQVDLFYTRVSLTLLGTLELAQEAPFTYAGVLGLINQQKNAQLSLVDFTIDDIPAMETGVITSFTLSATPESLVWLGNTQITLLTGIPNEAPSLLAFLNNDAAALFA